MANLGKVIYINEEDYSTLLNGGSITKGGTTYTYDSTALYVIKDVSAPEYAETAGYATSAGSAAQATKATQDGGGNVIIDTYDKKPLVIEVDDTDTTVPSGTYASITAALAAGRDVLLKLTYTQNDGEIEYLRFIEDNSNAYTSYRFANTSWRAEIYSDDSIDIEYMSENNHNHGKITSAGKLQTTDITIANGDKLVVTDASSFDQIARASLTFDGSTTTQALSKKGTWETFYQKPSTGIPETDLASAVQTSLGKADTSVQKITSTDNAIARFDGTGGQIQNSGVTIDDSNNITVPAKIQVQGTNTTNTTRYITSDSANTIYASVGGVASLVVNNTEVRRGSSASSINLGSSSYPWNNVYGKKFITNGGTSSQFVKGDGSLDSGYYIKDKDIIHKKVTSGDKYKVRVYDADIQDSFWGANERFVVTHKVYNVSDDSYVKDISIDLFKHDYEAYNNGVAEGQYAELYIGKTEDPVNLSGNLFVYPNGYIFLSFYYGKYPGEILEAKAYFRDSNPGWNDCTISEINSTCYRVLIPNRSYLAAVKIKYTGITPQTDTSKPTSLTDVTFIRNRDVMQERDIVTKYPYKQELYGNVEAPKFITRGATSSQFVKGDGSLDSTTYAPKASPALTGTPTAPTAAAGTNTTQIATTAFVQNALSNMGAGGSEMVDVTITGTTSAASFSANPYTAIKAVVDDGKIAVLNASVAPLSATGVLIPVYEYTYSQSGSDYTGYKGSIQHGSYEISVDVQSTSSATVTITELQSGGGTELITATTSGGTDGIYTIDNATYTAVVSAITNEKQPVVKISVTEGIFFVPMYRSASNAYIGSATSNGYTIDVRLNTAIKEAVVSTMGSSVEVDDELSETSTNPVQNNVITAQILENEEIVATALNNLNDRVELKQDQLVSGTTIKTINNQSILGSGNISISGGGGGDVNVIETVKVNGTALTPDANKAVNVVALQPDTAADLGQGTLSATNSQGFDFIIADEGTASEQTLQDALDEKWEGVQVITATAPISSAGYGNFSSNPYSSVKAAYDAHKIPVLYMQYACSIILVTYDNGTTFIGSFARAETSGSSSQYHRIYTVSMTGSTGTLYITDGYQKPSTGIPASDLASAVQTSLGKADTALQSYTETDPVFTASAAHGITAQDISNWNAKQNSLANTQNPYTAQGTSTKVPTITTNNLGQVTTITETNIDFPTLSKGTTSGSGNAVTDISVSGHTITLTKGSTFGTYSKPSGGIPDTDLATAVSQRLLPEASGSTDDGKIVQYSYTGGGWQLVKPITIYTGSTAPSSSTGSDGDIYIQTS